MVLVNITGSGHFSGKVEADSFVKDGGIESIPKSRW